MFFFLSLGVAVVTVELIRPWKRWDAGRRMERTAGAAEMLVARGIAKIVSTETRTRRPLPKPPEQPPTDPAPQVKKPAKRTSRPQAKKHVKRPAKKQPAKAAKKPTKRTNRKR